MQNKGVLYVLLIVIVLMGAVIAVQNEYIQKMQTVNVELISYSGDQIVKSDTFSQPIEKGWVGMQTDSEYVRENNITMRAVVLHSIT